MADVWTIRRMVAWMTDDFRERGIETARLDAELLVAHALGLSRVGLYMDLDRPLSEPERAAIRSLVQRRRLREPVAYLIGKREFYGLEFEVTQDTLVPRPDTETLVERALALLPKDLGARALDLGTGTGAIAVALAKERPLLSVVATDLSEGALAVARRNAERHGVADRVAFRHGDLFGALATEDAQPFDLLVSNPPYIPDGERDALQPDVLHEPRTALFSGADGLDCVRALLRDASRWMKEGGRGLVEIGAGQSDLVREVVSRAPALHWEATHKDLGGIERVVEFTRVPRAETA